MHEDDIRRKNSGVLSFRTGNGNRSTRKKKGQAFTPSASSPRFPHLSSTQLVTRKSNCKLMRLPPLPLRLRPYNEITITSKSIHKS